MRPDQDALRLRRAARNYRKLFSSRVYVVPVALFALTFSGHLVFISTSALVLIDQVGIGAGLCGVSFGVASSGLMAGGAIGGALVGRLRADRILVAGIGLGAVGSLALLGAALLLIEPGTGIVGAALIVVPMFFVLLGTAMSWPVATATALTPFRDMSGLAAAVLEFSMMAVSSIYAIAFAALLAPSAVTMAGAIAVSGVGAFLLVLLAGRKVIR